MPLPRWLKVCWQSSCLFGNCVLGLLRWSLWLLLILTAGGQVYILTSRELAVPEFVVRELEDILAEAGLHAQIGDISGDPTGRILLRDVQLNLTTNDTTVMRAETVFLRVDPWALWLRQIEAEEISVSGVDLLIPAVLSPTGRAEPVLRGICATVRQGDAARVIAVDSFTAHAGDIAIDMQGAFVLPQRVDSTDQTLDQLLASLTRNYVAFCRRASRILPHLPAMKAPRVSLEILPHPEHIAELVIRATAAEIDATAPLKSLGAARVEHLALSTRLIPGGGLQQRKISLHGGRLEWGPRGAAENIAMILDAQIDPSTGRFEPRTLDLRVQKIQGGGVTINDVSSHSAVAAVPIFQSRTTALVADSAWEAASDLDVTTGAGRVKLQAEVAAPTLELIGQLIGFDVPSILSWEQSPFVEADLNLAAGGKLLRAQTHISSGPLVARWVPLDNAVGRVTWEEHRLRADHVRVRRGDSVAYGSYDMDTDDLDFRFLLEGRLVPGDINGWFRDWWPNLFEMFDFRGGPPDASVEVSGRWRDPLDTRIFISADGVGPIIKGIPLDRMQTRLFVRPGWADVLHFRAERAPGPIEGSFLRQWKLPDSRRWTRVEIHAGGHSDLAPVPRLLPGTGDAIIEPFTFDDFLDLRMDGQVTRVDAGAPIHKNFTLTGSTTADWRYKNFPLQGVTFTATQTDGVTLIEDLTAGMAQGALTGRIELRDHADKAKQMAFDLNLEAAALGDVINDVAEWAADRRGETRTAESEFARQMEEGKLTVSLTATGPADDPFDLEGAGSVAISHANLANINLLGVLSTVLKRTILNFSTLQLSHLNADFKLAGPRVVFPEVKITGKRGAVDAAGEYRLDNDALDFTTRVRPFEGGEGLLDAVFTPFSSVLELKLSGQLADPEWTFVFGPTNLLRNLTGENSRTGNAVSPAAPGPKLEKQSPAAAPADTEAPATPPPSEE